MIHDQLFLRFCLVPWLLVLIGPETDLVHPLYVAHVLAFALLRRVEHLGDRLEGLVHAWGAIAVLTQFLDVLLAGLLFFQPSGLLRGDSRLELVALEECFSLKIGKIP